MVLLQRVLRYWQEEMLAKVRGEEEAKRRLSVQDIFF